VWAGGNFWTQLGGPVAHDLFVLHSAFLWAFVPWRFGGIVDGSLKEGGRYPFPANASIIRLMPQPGCFTRRVTRRRLSTSRMIWAGYLHAPISQLPEYDPAAQQGGCQPCSPHLKYFCNFSKDGFIKEYFTRE
jgi:hypothetical protein